MNMTNGRSASDLIQLHLISPAHVEPPPDVSNSRFAKVLRSVGASSAVHVRPRMITVVADTKYKTRSGMPVTLVGLHGKDELLVVGPDWAILRLANGEAPKTTGGRDISSEYEDALAYVVEEIYWLKRLGTLLKIAQGRGASFSEPAPLIPVTEEKDQIEKHPAWQRMADSVARYIHNPLTDKIIAEGMLQGMFGRLAQTCISQLSGIDLDAFIEKAVSDCIVKFLEFSEKLDCIYDVHPFWWAEWSPDERINQESQSPNFVTSAGRNISKYHFGELPEPDEAKPRRYSMYARWNKLLQASNAKVSPSEREQEIEGDAALEG